MKGLLILFLVFISVFSNGQTDTTYTPTRKGPLKSWRLAGVSLSGGNGFNYYAEKPVMEILDNITSSPFGKDKYRNDRDTFNWFKTNMINSQYNYTVNVAIRFTLKPRIINWNRFISFTELSAGLLYSYHEWDLNFYRSDEIRDTVRTFMTYYKYSSQSVSLELGGVIQTPGFFGFLALYTGPRIYAGVPYNTSTYTGSSYYEERDTLGFKKISGTTFYNPHSDFYKPVFIYGINIPVGAKFSISPRVNLFLEYVLNRRTTVFSNNYTSSIWYNGVEVGIRYKIIKQENIPEKEKMVPEGNDEPFY